MVLNDECSQWSVYEEDVMSRVETRDGPLEEALDFAHVVFKRFFVFVNESPPF
jgi:hypothetical protein